MCFERVRQATRQAVERGIQGFITGFANIFVFVTAVASVVLLTTTSLILAAIGWRSSSVVLVVVAMGITLVARRMMSWEEERMHLDVVAAAEMAYLVLLTQGVTLYNVCLISSAFVVSYINHIFCKI